MSRQFRDNPMPPADVAVYWVEYMARHGKDALKSPIVDLPWYQANLIDVYGFITLILLVFFYVLNRAIKICVKCMFLKKINTSSELEKKNK